MKTLKTRISIKLIYWITNIMFWIFSAAALLGIIMAFAILFNVFGNDLNLHVGLPSSFNIIEQGQLVLASSLTDVKIVEATGKINFVSTPGHLRVLYGIFMVCVFLLTFYLFFMFRRFVLNVYKGSAFDTKNINSLKNISYGLVVFWVFLTGYTITQHFLVAKHLKFNSIEITGNLEFYPSILIVALFLWVLSHIFVHGSQLEEETNLTI